VGGRVLRGLVRAPVPGQARLPVALAVVNVLAAAALGILLGANKTRPVLPGAHLAIVIGHAHLAAVGWALMMVMGAGYRLLPMVLPAAMPRGRWPYVATLLAQAGAWGIFLASLAGAGWMAPFAVLTAAGIAVFLSQVVWMARHRRPAPAERPRPDLGVAHVAMALVCLVIATSIGVALAFAPPSAAALRWAMAYGALGLVGFLSQMVVGIAGRIVPLTGWLWGFADRGHQELPPSLHGAPSRTLQVMALASWSVGVPSLTVGLATDRLEVLRAGASALGLGVLLGGANLALALRRLGVRTPGSRAASSTDTREAGYAGRVPEDTCK
jgi:hypothetical protein